MIYLEYAACEKGNESQRVAAKTLLNELLNSAFNIADAGKLMRIAKGGKPYIENAAFDFSAAHTEGAVAVAVAACGDGKFLPEFIVSEKSADKIGIDIEYKYREVKKESILRISKKLFGKSETEYLNIGNDGYKTRFLEIWTKKEAIVKANGRGLAGISDADTVSFAGVFLETYCVTVENREYIISVAAT